MTYRVKSAPRGWPDALPFRINVDGDTYGIGDEFDHEFTEADELANVESGLLEIVPRQYKVVGDTVVYDTKPGGVFERALTIGAENHLVGAGHIERHEPKPKRNKE